MNMRIVTGVVALAVGAAAISMAGPAAAVWRVVGPGMAVGDAREGGATLAAECRAGALVLGIYKGLRLLFADDAGAWRWFTAGNRDLPFAGVSPLAAMLRGSIDDLYGVRRYIDAWRGMK